MNADRFCGEPAIVPIISRCTRCNKPIYQGDPLIDIGEDICENCADDEDLDIGVKRVAGIASWEDD